MKHAQVQCRNRIMVEEIEGGMDIYTASRKFELCPRYIQMIYEKKTGKKVKPPKKVYLNANPSRDREIYELRLKGLTMQEIGNKYGISRERVRQIYEREKAKYECADSL